MKKKSIIIVLIFAFVAFIAYGLIWFFGIPITHSGLNYAEKYRNASICDCVVFTDDDFGEYEDIKFKVKDINGIFRSVGATYQVTYSATQYAEQKENIINEYNLSKETSYKNDEWSFKIINDNSDYPHDFKIIGFNDEKNIISYMKFTDSDFDGFDDFDYFISKYFPFKYYDF